MNEQAAAPDGAVTIVLATRNKGKVREMEEPLRAFGLRGLSLRHWKSASFFPGKL